MRTAYSDCHFHRLPITPGPGGIYFSCSASAEDWLPTLSDQSISPFIGLHPEFIPLEPVQREVQLNELESCLKRYPEAGIGECGLDKRFYKTINKALQEELLLSQLQLAESYQRPVCLHQVQAAGALLDCIDRARISVPVMLHGFTASMEILKACLKHSVYISIGPGVFRNESRAKQILRAIPEDLLLLETDWPYTYPHQSQVNYEDYIESHYTRVASILGIDKEALRGIVKRNGTLFKNRPAHR